MTAQDLINEILNTPLPTAPAVASAILQTGPDADVSAVREALRNDPALVAKLLKLANGPSYGRTSEIDNLPQAGELVGLRSVRMLSLSFSLGNANAQADLELDQIWNRSVQRATLAETFARNHHPELAEQAFLAGLLAEIGWLGATQVVPEQVAEILKTQRENELPLASVQADKCGWTHAEVSAALLQHWELPQTICDAVAAQHDPPLADQPLTGLLKAACAWMENAPTRAAAALQLDPNELESNADAINNAVSIALKGLETGEDMSSKLGQLQADAALQLAMLSMQTEAERFQLNRNEQAAREEGERLNLENKRILEAASTDGLTQIANRAAFDQRLEEELQRSEEQHDRMALLLLDVDHFKQFNDTYGHRAGDEVLRHVAEQLRQTAPGFVARYGGEEFAVVLSQNAAERAAEVGEQLRYAIASHKVPWNGEDLRVTASFGVAIIPAGMRVPANELIELSDQQLYAAKRAGRNRVMAAEAGRPGVNV